MLGTPYPINPFPHGSTPDAAMCILGSFFQFFLLFCPPNFWFDFGPILGPQRFQNCYPKALKMLFWEHLGAQNGPHGTSRSSKGPKSKVQGPSSKARGPRSKVQGASRQRSGQGSGGIREALTVTQGLASPVPFVYSQAPHLIP